MVDHSHVSMQGLVLALGLQLAVGQPLWTLVSLILQAVLVYKTVWVF